MFKQCKAVSIVYNSVNHVNSVNRVDGRGQQEFSIPGILDGSQLHFFSLDHKKWFSKVSISSQNMRVTICNLVLVSKYESGHMIISISSRQVRAWKTVLNLILLFSQEWEWGSKSKKMRMNDERIFGISKLKPQAFSLAALEMILVDIFVKVTSMMEQPDHDKHQGMSNFVHWDLIVTKFSDSK